MRIDHGDAIVLEGIVRNVFSCERAGMGGYIDADHFESEPFDAALIALAPLWKSFPLLSIEKAAGRTLRSSNGLPTMWMRPRRPSAAVSPTG